MPNKNLWLDILRGASAIAVCANHLRAAVFVEYAKLENPLLWQKMFYFVTGFGGQSVLIFFVLSGYLVGGPVITKPSRLNIRTYFISRLTRLWLVLIPALVMTAGIDTIIFSICPEVMLGHDANILHSGPRTDYTLNISTFLLNASFLQTIAAPVFGSNSPLWSLSNEFWYYAIFPFAVLSFRRGTTKFMRAVCASIAIAILALISDKTDGLIIWLIGAAFSLIPKKAEATPRKVYAAIILFLTSLIMSRLKILPPNFETALLAISTALLIASTPKTSSDLTYVARAFIKVSTISYTLYLTHFPVVLLLYALQFRNSQMTPTVGNLAIFLILAAFLVAFAAVMWMLFERHTEKVKKKLIEKFA